MPDFPPSISAASTTIQPAEVEVLTPAKNGVQSRWNSDFKEHLPLVGVENGTHIEVTCSAHWKCPPAC